MLKDAMSTTKWSTARRVFDYRWQPQRQATDARRKAQSSQRISDVLHGFDYSASVGSGPCNGVGSTADLRGADWRIDGSELLGVGATAG